jgi:hypothetical protein
VHSARRLVADLAEEVEARAAALPRGRAGLRPRLGHRPVLPHARARGVRQSHLRVFGHCLLARNADGAADAMRRHFLHSAATNDGHVHTADGPPERCAAEHVAVTEATLARDAAVQDFRRARARLAELEALEARGGLPAAPAPRVIDRLRAV